MAYLLLVEDESNVALALKTELEEQGHTVTIVGDGEAAMDRAASWKFDLILLDLGLPKKDGYAVCDELRRNGNRTPILMLTAKDSEADRVLGLKLGADDYVVKPFNHLELLARVKRLLWRTSSEKSGYYRFGDIEVDCANGEARRDGHPVDLTPLEFKLLTTFVGNCGIILSREQLLSLVWRPDTGSTYLAIDIHVANLRQKLESDPQHPRYIVNVRNAGYRFESPD